VPVASTGQIYAVAERRDGWTAIWYLGRKAWFPDPAGARTTVPRVGVAATPAPGRETVPVYSVAWPDASQYPADITPPVVTPLPYTFATGQRYAVGVAVQAEQYWAKQFDSSKHVVVRGKETYLQVQFGHRAMYVKLGDVQPVPTSVNG
jgi:hypothetical protein